MTQLPSPGLGERIKRYRKLNGWSAQKLADETGGSVTRSTIANVESGRRTDLTISQFLTICMALQVPPVALLVDVERPLELVEVEFPGTAPAPLSVEAPAVAVARWLNGREPSHALPSAARYERVSALVSDYFADRDALAATNARGRYLRQRRLDGEDISDEQSQLEEHLRRTVATLTAAGVDVVTGDDRAHRPSEGEEQS